MEYVTVGRGEIVKDKIKPIMDAEVTRRQTGFYKPIGGGIWFTKFYPEYPEYNAWVDHLIDNPTILYWNGRGHDMWNIPCSRVTLRVDAKIYQLDSLEAFLALVKDYPLDDTMFSYEKMSKDYDGIFIKAVGIPRCDNQVLNQLAHQCSIDSLLLFNPDAIEYYYSGMVHINEFDLEYHPDSEEGTTYQFSYELTKKRVR